MSDISMLFTSLIAEAIGLPPDAFDRFFDEDQQHKLKIVKYPEVDVPDLPADSTEADRKKWEIQRQGVGPHKDSMLTSYLLQASDQPGLQAQNARGEWVDCKPIPGTLVVAIGQGMEALTDGVCASTTHRVLSPRKGEGARYSVPFFQGVSYDARFEAMDVPQEVLDLRDEARKARKDDVEFTFVKGRWGHLGEATLMNRVKSHPDVGERWVRDYESLPDAEERDAELTVMTVSPAAGADSGTASCCGMRLFPVSIVMTGSQMTSSNVIDW
jgi:isopenicillin N synthase-like dioxygenase